MKKVFVAALFLIGIMVTGANNATAQVNKFGYFDLEQVVGMMPGVRGVDTALAIFEQDSLNADYQFRLGELQRNDSTLRADSAKMPARLYQERKTKLMQDFYLIQNWQQYSQQMMQAKQQELMSPYMEKVSKAFQQVVAEGKYTYVFNAGTLYHAPPADNLIPLVAKKLGIKLPNAPGEAAPAKPKPAGKP